MVQRRTIYGYYGDDKNDFLKITLLLPKYVSKAKGVLEHGFSFPGFSSVSLAPFESNLAYTLRFMIDCGVTGANWIELPAKKWKRRHEASKVSRCQLEVDVLCVSDCCILILSLISWW